MELGWLREGVRYGQQHMLTPTYTVLFDPDNSIGGGIVPILQNKKQRLGEAGKGEVLC